MTIPSHDELSLLHHHICQAVADPKRIQILYALFDQPRNVTSLAELLSTPQPTISRHLAVLRDRTLVTAERQGTSVIYAVADDRIIAVLETMRMIMRDALDRKASVIE